MPRIYFSSIRTFLEAIKASGTGAVDTAPIVFYSAQFQRVVETAPVDKIGKQKDMKTPPQVTRTMMNNANSHYVYARMTSILSIYGHPQEVEWSFRMPCGATPPDTPAPTPQIMERLKYFQFALEAMFSDIIDQGYKLHQGVVADGSPEELLPPGVLDYPDMQKAMEKAQVKAASAQAAQDAQLADAKAAAEQNAQPTEGAPNAAIQAGSAPQQDTTTQSEGNPAS